MAKYKRHFLLLVILYLLIQMLCSGHSDGSSTCAKTFVTSDLHSERVECSLSSLSQLYSIPVNFSMFDHLILTTVDMATECRSDSAGVTPDPMYALEGLITFSSQDELFQESNQTQSGSSLCVRLRSPPHTFYEVQAERIQGWMGSDHDVEVGFQDVGFLTSRALAKGTVLESSERDVVLVVKGLVDKFKHSSRQMTLSLAFRAVPECLQNRLQVVCPREGIARSGSDVVLLLDSGILMDNMHEVITTIAEVHIMHVSYNKETRMSLITSDREDNAVAYTNKATVDIITGIVTARHRGAVRFNTRRALNVMRTEVFTTARGDRPGIPNVAILMTGSTSPDVRETIKEARKARAQGIEIYVIGFGQALTNTAELDGIASEPVDKHRFNGKDSASLDTLREQFSADPFPGYIQTPHWNGRTFYFPSMDDCVTIEAPLNYSIMISFVMLDVETCRDCVCDFLEIYHTSSCRGAPHSTLCDPAVALPATYQTDVMSIRFTSDGGIQGTGFRLLFSFHSPDERPRQLRNGQWVCSGFRADVMLQHFICSFETFCSKGEDNTGDCPPADLCGDTSVQIDGRCYRYIRSPRKITWGEASESCQANKGYLASLNTEQEWESVAGFWTNTINAQFLMVGLRRHYDIAMRHLSPSTWKWSDQTKAYYLAISPSPGDVPYPPYCAVFKAHERDLTVISCNSPLWANYLCEMGSQTDKNTVSSHQAKVKLPSPSTNASSIPHMSECPNKEATLTLLLCEDLSRCYRGKTKECLYDHPLQAETMFTCQVHKQNVHYTLVCDHRNDCLDGSDEDFCLFPPCSSGEFSCWEYSQCIPRDLHCDGRAHCLDGSDEEQCLESTEIYQSNIVVPPAIINVTGMGGITITAVNISHNDSVCPETHFQCPGNGYCLPVFVRCDGVTDCPGGEDEAECESYTCPGFYRCHRAKTCVHADHLCDGAFQCPRRDDELMCNAACPRGCVCRGFAFVCVLNFSTDHFPQLRFLKADGTGMNLRDVARNSLLIYLSLKHCYIQNLHLVTLPNLQTLDLSHNLLTSFTSTALQKMVNLRSLSLAFNKLLSLNSIDFADITFPGLVFLDMSGSNTSEISNMTFLLFPNIEHLKLAGSQLRTVLEPGFSPLHDLQVLDLSDCAVTEFYGGMFKNLTKLHKIYTSIFHMCCPSILPEGFEPEHCHAPSDEVSSCAALLRTDMFRVFLVIYAIFALVANFVSFVYRVFGKGISTKLGFDIFVTHLCVSDFLMGVYLAIVGIADRIYYGDYEWNAAQWKQSVACQMAGFLSFLSSEVSAFLICFITLERFLVTRFPLKDFRFTPKSAHIACTVAWMLGALLAAIPLLPFSPPWDFYSQTGICIPLPITRKAFPGSEYSFLVMIVFNFILFLLIAAGQFLIFWSFRSQRKTVSRSSKTAKDMAVARRLLLVVMSDFLCWFPIGLLGLLARSGTPVSGDINVAMAIFVLPFNSALNPFLYTFHVLIEACRVKCASYHPKTSGKVMSGVRVTHDTLDQGLSTVPISTGGSVCNTTITEDDTTHEEVLRLIDRILQERVMTTEGLKRHLTELVTESIP